MVRLYVIYHPVGLQPIYVGKGTGRRMREHIVGRSTNKRLKRLQEKYAAMGVTLSGRKLAYFDSEQEAFAAEMARLLRLKLVRRYLRRKLNAGHG